MPTGPIPENELHPLAVAPPRREEGATVFVVGAGDVRVEGDPELVAAVVGRCDGRHTVEQIAATVGSAPDVRELIEALVERGVLVDSIRAWGDFHARSSNGPEGFPATPLDRDSLYELAGRRWSPEVLGRTEGLHPPDTRIAEIAGRRESARAGDEPRPVSFEELSALLTAMQSRGEGGNPTIPSAGGFFPLAIHAIVRRGPEPLEPGLWWHDPDANALALVGAGSVDVSRLLLSHPVTDPILGRGQPVLVISADVERSGRRYSNRAYRFACMEVGAAMQNAYLTGAELGVPVRAVGGFWDEPVRQALALPPGIHPMLAMVTGA